MPESRSPQRRELKADSYIRDRVASWPPWTTEQRETLAALLAPMRQHIAEQRASRGASGMSADESAAPTTERRTDNPKG